MPLIRKISHTGTITMETSLRRLLPPV
jgi:hypothetical protein